jgi:carbon-monoxide dehydrogenase iron sulfur subunit
MLIPGVEIPHLCAQCHDYPCVASCPFGALSVEKKTSAVSVDKSKCTACGTCIEACPGNIPHLHPRDAYILICDLCDGEPQCVKVCTEGGYNALTVTTESWSIQHKLFARTPKELTEDVAENIYAEKAKELL